MKTKKPLFLACSTVAHIVGVEAAALLGKIDHEALEYGRDWQMHGSQVFTAEGCARLADELDSRGHPSAAARLRTALKNAQAAQPEEPVGELVAVQPAELDESALLATSVVRRHRSDIEASPFRGE